MHNLKYIMPWVNGLAVFVILLLLPLTLGINLYTGVGIIIIFSSAGLSFLAGVKTYAMYGGVC